jgi:hypothetical protein
MQRRFLIGLVCKAANANVHLGDFQIKAYRTVKCSFYDRWSLVEFNILKE